MMDTKTDILNQPPKELPVIPELVTFMWQNNHQNVEALLKHTTGELLAMEGFGYRCLLSLYQLLQDHDCTHLMKQG